ncbi:MAG: gamma-glutamylcyclotransferase family protein [Mangrovicoccus sp.]
MDHVFGYGSLVNHDTHDHRPVQTAKLTGWRREWCLTSLRDVAFLSVRRAEGSEIEGLLAPVEPTAWAELDARERAYDRHDASHQISGAQGKVAVYQITPTLRASGEGGILLSYLDVVVQGYLAHFGEAGVDRFFASTDRWDRPILDDRAAPVYPRHRRLSPTEKDLVDQHIAALALSIRPL